MILRHKDSSLNGTCILSPMHSPLKTPYGYHSNLLSNTFSTNQLASLWALALACILIKHLVCWT